MKSKVIAILKFIIGWPLSFVALLFLFRFFSPQLITIQHAIKNSNIVALVIGICFFQCYFLFRILLWQKILQEWGHHVPLKSTAWYWSIAELNRYIPGNIWSIVSRGNTFSQFGISQGKLLLAWVAESILVLLGSLTISIFGLTLLFIHSLPEFPLRTPLMQVTLIGIILVDGIWIFHGSIKKVVWLPKKITALTFSAYSCAILLLLSSISYLFFGLGTYFTIQSLWYLPLPQILEFVGLFSASFLLGYISFITPMGLGIRELVMSAGLLGFLAKSVVGIATLYARVWLIISELLFLCISFLFHKMKKMTTNRFVRHIQAHPHAYALGLGIALYIAYFTTASFLRYTNFYTGRFDLGNMDQTVWNTMHGRIFQLTDPNGTNNMSRLGTHADFILILLTPFYYIWPDPRMLLLLQTVILAFGAIFVYFITKNLLKNKLASLILALTYLLNPSIGYANLYDFHAVTFATTFFLGAWYFIQQKKYWVSILFLILAGLTKEEAWIVIGFFGIYFIILKKKIRGVLLAALSFLVFYLLVWKFIPFARGGQHFALGFYADFGSTPTGIIKNIIFSPMKIISIILEKEHLLYYLQILLPLGYLSLASPLVLFFAVPDFAINVLSNNKAFHEIYYQYTSGITPFLFIAAIYSVAFITKNFPRIRMHFLLWYIVLSTIISAYLFGPLPGSLHPSVDMFAKQQINGSTIDTFLNTIPRKYSVAATNNIGSHLSHRQQIFTIPVGIDKADVIVFLLNDPFAQPTLKAQKEMALKLLVDPRYRLVYEEGDFIVFEKRTVHIEKP